MLNFKEYMNLQANIGQTVKNAVLQIINQPGNEQLQQAYARLEQAPQIYQAFSGEAAKMSNNSYRLSPSQWVQLIKKYSLKTANVPMPNNAPQQQSQMPQPPVSYASSGM